MKKYFETIIGTSLIFMILLSSVLSFTATAAENDVQGTGELAFLNDPGCRIGVSPGSIQEMLVNESYPNAQIVYMEKYQGYIALEQGKLDAYVYDKLQMELAIANGQSGVRVLDETIGTPMRIALGMGSDPSVPDLKDQVNSFIRDIRADGTLDDMYNRWAVKGDYTMPDIPKPDHAKYHLKIGTTGDVEPYSFYDHNTITGYDIELMYRFGAWLGADVEFQIYTWDSIVAAAQSGKVDIISSNLQKTEEREETIEFSDNLYEAENGVMVRDSGAMSAGDEDSSVHWQDYDGMRIGVITGTLMEDIAKEKFPNSEHLYFNSYPDLCTALLSKKVDAFLADEPNLKTIHFEQPEIDYIKDRIESNAYSFAFRKDDPKEAELCDEFNDFLEKIKEDGTLQEIEDIWLGIDEDKQTVDMSDLGGENGTIRVVTTSTDMPWSYVKDGKNVGYDIDLVTRFCRDRGYALELTDVDFSGRIPAVESGKCDFSTDMNVTPEREEQVLFSEPTYNGGVVLAVLTKDLEAVPANKGQDLSLWGSIRSGFEKTFIRENRYMLFLSGMWTTVLITVLSVLFGTALGFLVYMGCRNDNAAANAIAGLFVWLVQGMPAVVLLMILYYVIFAHAAVSGTAVSVIAFTLVFGAGVFGMLKSGVGAVDTGQTEAAYALGYGNIHTFFRIILPQAVPHFLPAYKGEIVALLKATAIVGYIAVQDLTKMGDIVRGRTYDAFFPLISVAVIYFVLGGLLTFAVNSIEISINPKRRKREDILKGVRTDD